MNNVQADTSLGYPTRAKICLFSETFRMAIAGSQITVQVITWILPGKVKRRMRAAGD